MKGMKKILVLLVAVCALFISCQKENTLKEVDDVCTKMDDSNFMKYCYDKFDVNHDGRVSMQEAAAVKRISCGGITSLKGIEYFTTITELRCEENDLTSLDVSKNTQLTVIDCSDNILTSLDVSKNTQLTALYCYKNNLTSLDVSKNTQLKKLNIGFQGVGVSPYNFNNVTVYYSAGQPVDDWKEMASNWEYGDLSIRASDFITWKQK